MNRYVKAISARLSLRTPQRDSLEILADLLESMEIGKHSAHSLKEELKRVQDLYPNVTDFEREFPSLCFALATGVGKTRLMGAFITYLYLAKGMKNFFVLAPNLTIYNKLIKDFTPSTPKYVFKGIAEFTNNRPVIITGENYEEIGSTRYGLLESNDEIHINIFNISKINSEVRGGKAPRIKRLSEYIGDSYFDYLSTLPDLVLLMDESHRYRASAGVKVLNELNPVLGLELTATPQIESGTKTIQFKNIIYSYPLFKAMEDGFVKEPAVATRENFNPAQYTEEELERIKLEDGITLHEETKVELEVYARQNHQSIIKPFVLIVAQDTQHAQQLMSVIQSKDFFEGRYIDKVITVHSNQRGEEKDDTIQQLVNVEDPASETEIVIHVNMLKEGWDVTNLYTIIPLRAANSKTLVEQSIGRGLRLPYGKRTGVKSVDRLTIIAHDKFQEIVDESNNPNSIIRQGIVIGRDVAKEEKQAIAVTPLLQEKVTEQVEQKVRETFNPEQSKVAISTSEIRGIIELVQSKVESLEYLPSSKHLNKLEVKQWIINEVNKQYLSEELNLFPEEKETLVQQAVEVYLEQKIQHSIDIPRILVQPVGEISWGYNEFELDTSNIYLQPIEENILIQHLRTHERETYQRKGITHLEERLEDYIISSLLDYPAISYDDHADLLYKLTGQIVEHIRNYLSDDNQVQNVIIYNSSRLADLIHTQMKEHFFQQATAYEVSVSKGFETLKPVHYTTSLKDGERYFREPVEDKSRIKSMVFGGFMKCLYSSQKFDSDSERRFAVICENDANVQKWFKPSLGQLKIYYGHSSTYNPDFVLETSQYKYICEIKKEDDLTDQVVQDKARAVVNWCTHASKHEKHYDGKEWCYLLIPHTSVQENMTIEGLRSRFLFTKQY